MKKPGDILKGVAGVLLLAALVASGCAVIEGTRLKWEKIADGSGAGEEFVNLHYADLSYAYAGHAPRLIVVTDTSAASTLQGRVLSSHLERIAEVDFSSSWVAVIYQGRQVMKDYLPIEVNDVTRRGNTVAIYAQFHEPPGSLDTSPYYILKIEKLSRIDERKLSFTLKIEDQIIPQICAMRGEHLPWEKMVFDRGVDQAYRGRSPQLVVIASLDALSSIQDQFPPQYLEILSDVDFTTHFAIVIYQGLKESTHYSVEVIDVKRQDSTIFVCTQFHEPLPEVARGSMETSPFYIMKVEKSEGLKREFVFTLTDHGDEIFRQTEIIP